MQFDACVVGLGYIGLPTALLLAEAGMKTLGVDVNEARVQAINEKTLHSTEPGLTELLSATLDNGNFQASTQPFKSASYILAVPTPLDNDRTADLSYIWSATDRIIPLLEPGSVIAIESTCPPGTTSDLKRRVELARPDLDGKLHFVYCPERILPGNAIAELRLNERTLGGITVEDAQKASQIYSAFCDGALHLTDATTAEMVKLTENAYRDVNIAFANELSLIADKIGVSPWEVIQLANRHPRVNILKPGPGVGGHCIAVDPWFLVGTAPEEARLIETARSVNDGKPQWVIEKVEGATDPLSTKAVVLLGMTFKPDIDDLRESPALEIAEKLAIRNPETTYVAVEPNVDAAPIQLEQKNITWCREVPDLSNTQLIVWLVDHKEFKEIDWSALPNVALLDARGDQTRLS